MPLWLHKINRGNIHLEFFSMRLLYFLGFLSILWSCSQGEEPTPQPPSAAPTIGSASLQLLMDSFEGKEIVLVGSGQQNIIVSFFAENMAGEPLSFELIRARGNRVLQDQHGNVYNVFGEAVEGPDQGSRLKPTYGFMSYWFAVTPFHEQVVVFGVGAGQQYPPIQGTNGWLVPSNNVLASTAKDAIPSIDAPEFVSLAPTPDNSTNPNAIRDDELVIGVLIDGELHLYPHKILNWHEIINDQIEDTPFSVFYCPLTGTANAWSRMVKGEATTFGVSGLLYNSNIVPYDRATDSYWSQLYGGSINGALVGTMPEPITVVETTWLKWKNMYNNPPVLSFDTGYGRDYEDYPYGDYRENNNSFLFPLGRQDDRLPAKERVHVIVIGQKAKAYRLSDF